MSETTADTERATTDASAETDARARWRAPVEPMGDTDAAGARVLVLTGLGHKNALHYGPLADIAEEMTLVCLDPDHVGEIENANYVQVPDFGPRILRVLMLFVVALLEGYRNEYDTVASISLVPYGLYALALKKLYGYQAFLGIIGIDLDHHAEQWYGAGPRWAFRQFDAVSVPGSDHAERLLEYGLERDRIHILTNAIDTDTYHPIPADIDTAYDFVWVGRFGPEKDPVLFVEALAELEARDTDFQAVMVGNGTLRTEVIDAVAAHGLEDRIDFAGWVDEPLSYYRQSDTFVLTSRRDALPLAMLEAMASGLPAVVPDIGSVTDAVTDGENGVVVDSRHPRALAAAMERCLDDEYRGPLAEAAPDVRESVSMDEAETDWRNILTTLGNKNTAVSSTRD
ncbi:glycosyltransferase family 4 protein [Natronolimnobius sp. AArcel1]|uniref:glycosyltransferase n=1 Tax=Natronolimnobius sp. AArcel1 TaxID=1679093 RepID=UPI0013EC749B|nr:glycosyltransferase [Natronolimnobius sp. AArcel1]NGM71204.1 glycosyltransferase family 4 protein [Natronolimnobius sp. AArcel1]